MPIIWRDSMAIGQTTIDSEHKYLFCLINAVELALQIDNAHEVVRFYVGQLDDYTSAHFHNEEKIQLRINYPHYAEHKVEHQQILEQLALLQQRLQSASPPAGTAVPAQPAPMESSGFAAEIEDYDPAAEDPAPPAAVASSPTADKAASDKTLEDVVQFLRCWILDHVLKTDIKMRPYLKNLK